METKIIEETLEMVISKNLVALNLDEIQQEMKKSIEENDGIKKVELSLQNVAEIDSLGINLIVGLYKTLSSKDIDFAVINTNRSIKTLFSLFKLSSYFNIS